MKAAVSTEYGPPDVVRIVDVPRPVPGDDEVLVQVHAATVNRTVCGFRAGTPFIVRAFSGLTRPRVTVLGDEFAGVIAEVGTSVTEFAVGDRVFGYSEWNFGAHAEYIAMPANGSVALIPSGVSFVEAAPSTEGSHYAWSMIRAVRVEPGQDVLVNGATGAIGSAAVQLLKALDATVTATCATAHLDLVAGLGADRVIDYTAVDFTTDDQRYDVVMDAVGKSTFGRCRGLLKPGGRYLSSDLGPGWQNPVLGLVTPWFGGRAAQMPIPPRHTQEETRLIAGLIEAGKFRAVIDRTYPLDDIVEAYRYVETGQKIGNVVIVVAPDE